MTDDTPEIMIRMVQELDEVIWERKTTAAEVQRQLGWKKSRLSDLQVFPSRLTMSDLLQVLEVVGMDKLEFMQRVHGRTASSERLESVRVELEGMLTRLAELSEELRDGPEAAKLVVWGARNLVRPLVGALSGGASQQRMERALLETMGMALAVYEQGGGGVDKSA